MNRILKNCGVNFERRVSVIIRKDALLNLQYSDFFHVYTPFADKILQNISLFYHYSARKATKKEPSTVD